MTGPGRSPADDGRSGAVLLASLLLAAGVVIATSPLTGQVVPADGAPMSAFLAAGWVAVVPGLLAVTLALVRPALGLAATAGSGLIGLSRLLADLAVVAEIDRVSRPELFVETTDRARPLLVGAGGWVLLAADMLMLVVGVLASRRLAGLLWSGDELRGDVLFGAPADREPVPGVGDDPRAPTLDESAVAQAMGDGPPSRRRLNLPMMGTGFLGAVLLLVGSLDVPYTGGYLLLRVLPFGTSVSGLAAAVVLAVTVAAVVLVAGGLPASIARAMLGGAALAAAVPSLTAVVAVAVGAPTGLAAVVWWAIGGAVLVAAAGLFAGRGGPQVSAGEGTAGPRATSVTAAVAGLLGAAALAGASQTALLYLDGAPPDEVAGVLLTPASLPLLIAAVPLAVAAVLTLVPATVGAGRAALLVVWAGAGYALGRALWATSLVSATSSGSVGGVSHTWTVGPGGYLMVVGALGAVVAAVFAAIATRQAAEMSIDVVDDRSLTDSRGARRWNALILTALVLGSLAMPVYSGLGVSSAPTLISGLDLDTWAFWSLAIGALLGVWIGAVTRFPMTAAGAVAGSAAVLAQPLFVPGAVRSLPGFALATGFWLLLGTVFVTLCVAVVAARSAGGIELRPSWPADGDRAAQGRMRDDQASGGPGARVESKGG
ncbi:hypothetical protein [Nakamurella sp.]|uniref:hypothetical protein n=1 Tax=Nakamurella sp. TaxID=1869182 RepID=UPI003783CA04